MARPVLEALRLLQAEESAAPMRPVALVGRGSVVDAVAAALLAGGGDRRALAPLPAAGPDQLRRCLAVVACNLSLEQARLVARAHRPWIALLPPGDDRYAFGALPRLGALSAIPPSGSGAPAVETALDRLVAVLDPDDAVALGRRLPALVSRIEARFDATTAVAAAIAATTGAPAAAVAIAAARTTARGARLTGGDPRPAAAITGGLVLAALARDLPRPLRGALAAAAAIGARRVRARISGRPGYPTRR